MYEQKQYADNIQFLTKLLENDDDVVRRKARKSLVLMGKKATPSLLAVLENSKIYKARWEAAKALGSINDARAIHALVIALEDEESDVAWLAAKALEKFGKAAWVELFQALVKRGSESIQLQHGAHHILRKQEEEGLNDLLENLRKALQSVSVPESISLAAYNILMRMKKTSGLKETSHPEYSGN
jgi:hypothetical protein